MIDFPGPDAEPHDIAAWVAMMLLDLAESCQEDGVESVIGLYIIVMQQIDRIPWIDTRQRMAKVVAEWLDLPEEMVVMRSERRGGGMPTDHR